MVVVTRCCWSNTTPPTPKKNYKLQNTFIIQFHLHIVFFSFFLSLALRHTRRLGRCLTLWSDAVLPTCAQRWKPWLPSAPLSNAVIILFYLLFNFILVSWRDEEKAREMRARENVCLLKRRLRALHDLVVGDSPRGRRAVCNVTGP
jgi:hypothetical protein